MLKREIDIVSRMMQKIQFGHTAPDGHKQKKETTHIYIQRKIYSHTYTYRNNDRHS